MHGQAQNVGPSQDAPDEESPEEGEAEAEPGELPHKRRRSAPEASATVSLPLAPEDALARSAPRPGHKPIVWQTPPKRPRLGPASNTAAAPEVRQPQELSPATAAQMAAATTEAVAAGIVRAASTTVEV